MSSYILTLRVIPATEKSTGETGVDKGPKRRMSHVGSKGLKKKRRHLTYSGDSV